jgi:hypothetical protein
MIRTSMSILIIISRNAEHGIKYRITKEEFQKFPMHNGFNIGDIIILRSGRAQKLC